MTDIQYIALSLAILVVLGVLGYNFFLDYRHSKVARDLIKRAPHNDGKDGERDSRFSRTFGFAEPSLSDGDIPKPDAMMVDPQFEWSAKMEFQPSVKPADLFDETDTELQLILQSIQKPITWLAFDSALNQWRFIYKGGADFPVEHLRVNLLLCNRSGPASVEDMDAFEDFLEGLGKKWNAQWEVDDIPVENIALAMDRFCADVDLEIMIKVLADKTFSREKLRAWADGMGMQYQHATGDFVFVDSNDRECYRVEIAAQVGDNIKSVNFILDVPCTAQGEETFHVMVQDAQSFAKEVEGMLVDDKNAPLLPMQLENIAAQFVALPQRKMQEIGIPAGSPQALRLFSS